MYNLLLILLTLKGEHVDRDLTCEGSSQIWSYEYTIKGFFFFFFFDRAPLVFTSCLFFRVELKGSLPITAVDFVNLLQVNCRQIEYKNVFAFSNVVLECHSNKAANS